MNDSRWPNWPRYAAAALGFLWYLQLGGGQTLNPLNTVWLLTGDWQQHWFGFLFFLGDPWSFPLGNMPSLLHPIGTNIGLTDSNPLLSILVKPFAGVLPAEFQLIGPWLAACFVLQGYMGAALTSTVTKDPAQQIFGGYLFVLSPVLVPRLGHDTLCAQWVLLGLLYLGLREHGDRATALRTVAWTMGAVVFAGSVHPYLAAMTLALAVGVFVRLWRSRMLSLTLTTVSVLVAMGGLVAVWAAIGYLGGTPDGSGGFDKHGAHLFTLFDPRDFGSRLLPKLPSTPTEWEGYGFLGLGGIVAAAIATGVVVRRRPAWRPGVWAPIGVCLLLAIYALSSHVRAGNVELLNLEWLYAPVMPLVKPFRSAGRFIWPLHYLVLLFGIWGVIRAFGRARPHVATVMLALVVIVQATDFEVDRPWARRERHLQISLEPFRFAGSHYRHLKLAPMQVLGACGDPYEEDHVYRFMLLAHRLNLTYNSGIYARLDVRRVQAACQEQDRSIDAGALDPETIYVVSPAALPRFQAANAACGRWDGDWFCVDRASNPRFATWIETGK